MVAVDNHSTMMSVIEFSRQYDYLLPLVKRLALAARYSAIIVFVIVVLRVTLLWEHGYSVKDTTRYNLQRNDKFTRWAWICVSLAIVVFNSPAEVLRKVNSPVMTPLIYETFLFVATALITLGGVFKMAALSVGRGADKAIILSYFAIPAVFMLLTMRHTL
jgi:hypothetical protein